MTYTEEVYKEVDASSLNPKYRGVVNAMIVTGSGSVSGYFAPGEGFSDVRAKPGSLWPAGNDMPTPVTIEVVNGNFDAAKAKMRQYLDTLIKGIQ